MKLTVSSNQIKVRNSPNLDYYVMLVISIALILSAVFFFVPNFLKIAPNFDLSHVFKSQNIVTTVSFFLVTLIGNILPFVLIYQYFTKFNSKIVITDGELFCDGEWVTVVNEIEDIQVVFHFEDDCNHICFITRGEKHLLPMELSEDEAAKLYDEIVKLTGFKKNGSI